MHSLRLLLLVSVVAIFLVRICEIFPYIWWLQVNYFWRNFNVICTLLLYVSIFFILDNSTALWIFTLILNASFLGKLYRVEIHVFNFHYVLFLLWCIKYISHDTVDTYLPVRHVCLYLFVVLSYYNDVCVQYYVTHHQNLVLPIILWQEWSSCFQSQENTTKLHSKWVS